ncbi:MAG: sulfite exporter TauE/SafE family protein, partial [Pseudomonadota bacterium]|nr:sulfite exporter TauE/SafE family protein [Pseudomonadota bacterium]
MIDIIFEILLNYIINVFSLVTATELLISAFILFISGSIQGYSGFGGGTVSVPILVILFGPITAVGIITPIYILGAAAILPNALRSVDWKEVVPCAVAGSLSVFVGLSFLVDTDPNTTKKVMGSVVLLTTLLMIFGRQYTGPRN